MKKILLALVLLLLSGCAAKNTAPSPAPEPPEGRTAPGILWTRDDMPVSVEYYRMWEYGAEAESDDPALIADLVDAIRAVGLGAETDWVTEDYTDIVTFRFEDGSTLRFEFENQCYVSEDQVRYEADGLGRVRAILNDMIGDFD